MNRTTTPKAGVITGFGAFPGVLDNPTAEVVAAIAAQEPKWPGLVDLRVLEVTYAGNALALDEIMRTGPAFVLMLGYSRHASCITLETRAHDGRDPDSPDADGVAGQAPASARDWQANASIDFAALEAALSRAGLPCELSGDAGDYVCNDLYRGALRRAQRAHPRPRVLFVHLPALPDTPLSQTAAGSLPLADMVRAIRIVFTFLQGGASQGSRSGFVHAES